MTDNEQFILDVIRLAQEIIDTRDRLVARVREFTAAAAAAAQSPAPTPETVQTPAPKTETEDETEKNPAPQLVTERILDALRQADHPLRSREVWETMRDPVGRGSVASRLSTLGKAGIIQHHAADQRWSLKRGR